jgi:hypothetical protein
MWWQDLLWGFWNGLTAWIVLIVHIFGGWDRYAVYDTLRRGNWYDLGFLIGAGSPLLGALGGKGRGGERRSVQEKGRTVPGAADDTVIA